MKTIILAGGRGTRLSEITKEIPKPLIKIGDKPIVHHIIDIYSKYKISEFIVALGYKADLIKKYFYDYNMLSSDFKIDLSNGRSEVINSFAKKQVVSLIDTGINTLTGGRIKRLEKYIKNETFLLTYGDAVSSVNISDLMKFHKDHGKLVTMTAIKKRSQFGVINSEDNKVINFAEKPEKSNDWINGGFFVIEPKFLEYLENDETILEREPLENIAKIGELMIYKHHGFWQSMDSLKDFSELSTVWIENNNSWPD